MSFYAPGPVLPRPPRPRPPPGRVSRVSPAPAPSGSSCHTCMAGVTRSALLPLAAAPPRQAPVSPACGGACSSPPGGLTQSGDFTTALGSCGCQNHVPPAGWMGAAGIGSLRGLAARPETRAWGPPSFRRLRPPPPVARLRPPSAPERAAATGCRASLGPGRSQPKRRLTVPCREDPAADTVPSQGLGLGHVSEEPVRPSTCTDRPPRVRSLGVCPAHTLSFRTSS